MWVFEEFINGRKLSEIINQEHENVKYLPGYKIPQNVVSWKRKLKITEFVFLCSIREATSEKKLGSNSLLCCGLPPNSLHYNPLYMEYNSVLWFLLVLYVTHNFKHQLCLCWYHTILLPGRDQPNSRNGRQRSVYTELTYFKPTASSGKQAKLLFSLLQKKKSKAQAVAYKEMNNEQSAHGWFQDSCS